MECPYLIFFSFIDPRERGREGERNGNIDVREKLQLPLGPLLGTECETQACALTRNLTCNLSVCRKMPNQLSHTSQGVPDYLVGAFSISPHPVPNKAETPHMVSPVQLEKLRTTGGWDEEVSRPESE